MFLPKILTTLGSYSRKDFIADIIAGIIVGIVAIPLSIAFGIASGVTPEKGLITAVIAGFLISALGGSRVQIGGPTGAFVVIIYDVVQKYGVDGLIIATFLAGIILIAMGIAKFGSVIKYIPYTVVVGFTSGIAVIIFSSQVKDFLGLTMGAVPAEIIPKWQAYWGAISSANIYACGISLLTIGLVVWWPRISERIPGTLIAFIVTSCLVTFLQLPVETIGSRFGTLPTTLPFPQFPVIDFSKIGILMQPALIIAMLGAIESLLSAVVADGMIGGKHRSNTELIGQGIANVGSALFGGIPATGAIARTVTNIRNGGKTPVAGLIHALTILVCMLFFMPFIQRVPMACLAGILTVIAYRMSEWRSFRELLQSSKGEIAVLLVTFGTTVFIDLTTGIQIGMILAAVVFIRRMANAAGVNFVSEEIDAEDREKQDDKTMQKIVVPRGVEVYEINGPFFFGVANKFDEAIRIVSHKPIVRIIRLQNVPMIDSSGMNALKAFHHKCKSSHIHLLITGLHVQPLSALIKNGLYDLVGEENVFGSIKDALERAEKLIASHKKV